MNSYRYLPGIVLVLLLTVVAMVFRGMILTEREEGGSGAAERGGVSRDLDPGTDGAKSSRRERLALSPAAGLWKLRSLLGEGAEEAPEFRELEAMARRVKSADLWQLVESSQQDTAWTLGGWVRAAALAELSRREPNGTLGEVFQASWVEDATSLHAALFAVFRGWSEIDPVAAIEALSRTSILLAGPNYETGIFRSEGRDLSAPEEWKEQAYREVFAQWARRNPDNGALPLPPGGKPDYRTAAWEGLLRGLRDPGRIRKLLAVRLEEMSGAAPLLNSFEDPEGTVQLVPPSADPVVVAGLLSLARGGVSEPLAWLKEHPLTSLTVSSDFLRQYGAAHPGRALDLLEDPAMDANALATGIVSRDPARAVEVIEASIDSLETGKVLLAALSAGGLGEAGNRYPGSGALGRPLDIKQRADFLKGAIDDSSLDQAVKAILHLEIEVQRIEYETASEVGHIKGAIRFPNVDEDR